MTFREITPSDNEVSEDESLSAEDLLESSESASLDSFEEKNEFWEMSDNRRGLEPSYFSSLSFSFSSYANQLAQKPSLSHFQESFSSEVCGRRKDPYHAICSYHGKTDVTYGSPPHQCVESNLFLADDTECTDDQNEVSLPFRSILDEVSNKDISSSSDGIYTGNIASCSSGNKNEHLDDISVLQNASNGCSWGSKYNSKFLSTNPILSKSYFFSYSIKEGESNYMNHREALPHFDFSCIRDPHKVCEGKLTSAPRQQIGAEFPILANTAAAANLSGSRRKEGCSHGNSQKKSILTSSDIPSNSKDENWKDTSCSDIRGGSGWETLLACFYKTPGLTAKGYKNISAEVFEMPMDYVIKKCLWEQILLQYPCEPATSRIEVYMSSDTAYFSAWFSMITCTFS